MNASFLPLIYGANGIGEVKDPVLPMILSGLTMNFMLYEKDYGLAIARLHCHFNLPMNVVKLSF